MREHGIQGIYRRKGRKNLVNAATGEDLVKRQFAVGAPDELWLTDITEHPTAEGKLYCAAVMDAFPRKIIGWSMDKRQDTNLVVNALAMAVTRRQPEANSTVLHSDHGTQYQCHLVKARRLAGVGFLAPDREHGLSGRPVSPGKCALCIS
jgi:putative transposase